MRKTSKNEIGITLIALVITIIVLLILAGVSIATLTGENGVLAQAQHAKTNTERASVIEESKTDVLGKQAENESGLIARGELKIVLDKYFKDVPEDYTIDTVLTTKDEYGKHEISVSEIYNGEFKGNISKTESYVGYYADINSDGTVDGIIYADLAVGGSGQWDKDGWCRYKIPVEDNLKDYYISQTGYKGTFGTKDVLSPIGSGKDRFYVMALTDIDGKQNDTYYCWYAAAYGKLDNYIDPLEEDFGKGKENTETMMTKWESKAYGAQDQNLDYKDMWGQIKDKVEQKWFVPSKGEWSAFGGELGITRNNYKSLEISPWCWSSSQFDVESAYSTDFNWDTITGDWVDSGYSVRLSTTF